MKDFITSLIELQSSVGKINKDAKGNWGMYASLPHVQEKVLPELKKHGFALVQPLSNLDGTPAVRTILMHESGETIEDITPLILPKNDPQGQGSATTYARRYALCSILGLVIDDDDDAQSSTDSVKSKGAYKASSNKPATDKQKVYLAQLYAGHSARTGDQRDLIDWLQDEYGVVATEMTSADISQVIEELK